MKTMRERWDEKMRDPVFAKRVEDQNKETGSSVWDYRGGEFVSISIVDFLGEEYFTERGYCFTENRYVRGRHCTL